MNSVRENGHGSAPVRIHTSELNFNREIHRQTEGLRSRAASCVHRPVCDHTFDVARGTRVIGFVHYCGVSVGYTNEATQRNFDLRTN